jgi:hypothetical protein
MGILTVEEGNTFCPVALQQKGTQQIESPVKMIQSSASLVQSLFLFFSTSFGSIFK